MVEDAIGLIILAFVAIVIVTAVGFGLLFSLDVIASVVSWIGQGPTLGWTLVGTIGGTIFGVKYGMRVRGKSDGLRKAYVTAGIALGILLAFGVFSPAGRVLLGR